MGFLQGKGLWTLRDDVESALSIAPGVGAQYVLCEVSDEGFYDAKQASTSLEYLRSDPSLTPVAWVYLLLDHPADEANAIQRALEDGFAAVVLDAGLHTARKFVQAEKLVQRVLEFGLDLSHIYLCGEANLDSSLQTYPYQVLAKVCRGGYMPRIYDETSSPNRRRKAERVIADTFAQYERHKTKLGYTGLPLPVLGATWDAQGRARMTQAELTEWCQAVEAEAPEFVSLFRAGTLHPEAWPAFDELQIGEPVGALGLAGALQEVLIQPGDPHYQVTTYPPHPPGSGWTMKFTDVEGHAVHVRNTTKSQAVAVSYRPALPKKGRYTVEVFIPGTHATTRGAQYFIVHHPNGQRQEAHQIINQFSYSDEWILLGTFELDPQQFESGRVNLVDVTNDPTVKEIAFTAIRWRSTDSPPPPPGGPGYDAPIGTALERASAKVWPGSWLDATGYAVTYPDSDEYHTGADLNLNVPVHDSDKGAPVYASADGVVAHAFTVPGSWGGLIVIRHTPLPDGTPVYSRYAHVEQMAVKQDDTVSRGQQIAVVGYYAPGKNYHLHFDVSCTSMLETVPRHWPGTNKQQVLIHYVDPRKFIAEHRPS
jgi:hypothetical protein